MASDDKEKPAGTAEKKQQSKLSLRYMARRIFWSEIH
jgi:hypothetical protein